MMKSTSVLAVLAMAATAKAQVFHMKENGNGGYFCYEEAANGGQGATVDCPEGATVGTWTENNTLYQATDANGNIFCYRKDSNGERMTPNVACPEGTNSSQVDVTVGIYAEMMSDGSFVCHSGSLSGPIVTCPDNLTSDYEFSGSVSSTTGSTIYMTTVNGIDVCKNEADTVVECPTISASTSSTTVSGTAIYKETVNGVAYCYTKDANGNQTTVTCPATSSSTASSSTVVSTTTIYEENGACYRVNADNSRVDVTCPSGSTTTGQTNNVQSRYVYQGEIAGAVEYIDEPYTVYIDVPDVYETQIVFVPTPVDGPVTNVVEKVESTVTVYEDVPKETILYTEEEYYVTVRRENIEIVYQDVYKDVAVHEVEENIIYVNKGVETIEYIYKEVYNPVNVVTKETVYVDVPYEKIVYQDYVTEKKIYVPEVEYIYEDEPYTTYVQTETIVEQINYIPTTVYREVPVHVEKIVYMGVPVQKVEEVVEQVEVIQEIVRVTRVANEIEIVKEEPVYYETHKEVYQWESNPITKTQVVEEYVYIPSTPITQVTEILNPEPYTVYKEEYVTIPVVTENVVTVYVDKPYTTTKYENVQHEVETEVYQTVYTPTYRYEEGAGETIYVPGETIYKTEYVTVYRTKVIDSEPVTVEEEVTTTEWVKVATGDYETICRSSGINSYEDTNGATKWYYYDANQTAHFIDCSAWA